jgi:hypothetical protein
LSKPAVLGGSGKPVALSKGAASDSPVVGAQAADAQEVHVQPTRNAANAERTVVLTALM